MRWKWPKLSSAEPFQLCFVRREKRKKGEPYEKVMQAEVMEPQRNEPERVKRSRESLQRRELDLELLPIINGAAPCPISWVVNQEEELIMLVQPPPHERKKWKKGRTCSVS